MIGAADEPPFPIEYTMEEPQSGDQALIETDPPEEFFGAIPPLFHILRHRK